MNNHFVDMCFYFFFFLFLFFLIHSRGGEGRETERERNIDVREKHQLVASCTHPTGNLTHNPGMCPNQESNLLPPPWQDDAQPTEPHWPGHFHFFKIKYLKVEFLGPRVGVSLIFQETARQFFVSFYDVFIIL